MCNFTGISQKTVMLAVSLSTSGITPPTNTGMAEKEKYSADPGKRLSSELPVQMPFLFGENSSMVPASLESTVPSSEMKVRIYHPTLSDRLTQSLISVGLVKGITPMSTRKQLGARIPDIVSWRRDGGNVGKPRADC